MHVKLLLKSFKIERDIHALKNHKPLSRIMGNSQPSRENPCHAFKSVGVAFDRPITTKFAHKRKTTNSKLQMYPFICMCIKAVHFEIVSNMSTDPQDLIALTTAHVLICKPLIQLLYVNTFF